MDVIRRSCMLITSVSFCFFQNGENYRCGNPLAKDYISKMEDGTLVSSSGDHSAHKTLVINKMISSWRNAQKRVRCG